MASVNPEPRFYALLPILRRSRARCRRDLRDRAMPLRPAAAHFAIESITGASEVPVSVESDFSARVVVGPVRSPAAQFRRLLSIRFKRCFRRLELHDGSELRPF